MSYSSSLEIIGFRDLVMHWIVSKDSWTTKIYRTFGTEQYASGATHTLRETGRWPRTDCNPRSVGANWHRPQHLWRPNKIYCKFFSWTIRPGLQAQKQKDIFLFKQQGPFQHLKTAAMKNCNMSRHTRLAEAATEQSFFFFPEVQNARCFCPWQILMKTFDEHAFAVCNKNMFSCVYILDWNPVYRCTHRWDSACTSLGEATLQWSCQSCFLQTYQGAGQQTQTLDALHFFFWFLVFLRSLR